MNSPDNKAPTFSWEDFEKGLMLAGIILPQNAAELRELKELEQYEKELQKEKNRTYFKRAVLAAEITSELHREPTFGRVKFQKLVYLCEHVAHMNLNQRYGKFAAGPFDNKFMHSIESEFQKQHWFEVKKVTSGKITRSEYVPLEKCSNYKQYYESYFGTCASDIKYIIDLFRFSKTDNTEVAATLFACYLELLEKAKDNTEEELLRIFYDWSKEKSKFTKDFVLATWRWMIQQEIFRRLLPELPK